MSSTLTKADIISSVQTENGYSINKSTEIVESLLEIIKSTLQSGEDVMISKFGKFQIREKRERKGRNPATDENMILPAKRVVAFKCAGSLRERINSG